MILAFGNDLPGYRKSVGIGDEEIPVHVIAGCDAGSRVAAGFERMPRVARNAADIDDADRIQHYTTVLVKKHAVSDRFANGLQSNALRLERRSVGTVV